MGKTVVSVSEINDTIAEVEVVNSISHKYPKERQESKSPTFALTR